MKILHTFRLNRIKWAPLGIAGTAPPRNSCQNDSFYGDSSIPPVSIRLSAHFSHPSQAFFPFAVGDIFIALSIAWVIFYPIYEIGLRKKLARRYFFLTAKRGSYPKKKVVFGRVAEYLLWVYAWFYIAWGLNYSQPNIYDRIGMKPVEVSEAKFKAFAYQYADSLNALSISSDIAEE